MSDEGSGVLSKTTLAAGLAVATLLGLVVLTVIVVGALAVGAVFFTGGSDQVPAAQFDFQHRGEDVVVTMTDGDPIDGRRVWVVIGEDAPGTWTDYRGEERIDPGDAITITRADPGDTIRLLWTPPGGGDSRELASYEFPG